MSTTARNETSAPIHDLLANRWSPRGFDATHVISLEELNSVLEAGRWSASMSNSQPWHFIAARRGTPTFERIVASMMGFNQAWTPATSALILLAERRENEEGDRLPVAEYDLGQAAAHMSVQAEALGLHAHQMLGFHRDELNDLVPEGYQPYTLLSLGLHADDETVSEKIRERDASPRERLPLEAITTIDA